MSALSSFGIVLILWLSYGLLHSLLASTTVKKWASQKLNLRGRYYRMVFIVLSILFLLPPLFYHLTLYSNTFWTVSSFQKLLGAIFSTSGVFIVKRAFDNYSFKTFIGVSEEPDDDKVLKTSGLQSKVRHPLYLGTLMFLWGWFIFSFTSSNLALALALHFYVLMGIYWEEKKLLITFGESYRAYRREVPKLIPQNLRLHKSNK